MVATVILLLLPLTLFKYSFFIAKDVLRLNGIFPVESLKVPLPIGISFVTFTMIAYVFDVYYRRFQCERSLGLYTGYTLFFPQLIAGPILRPAELIPQIKHNNPLKQTQITMGALIFSIGLLKKLVFADSIGSLVDYVYNGGHALSGWYYLSAMYGFSVQIYCDFSGYTDMAIGSAMILGIVLPLNFNRPYLASSVSEFWRCWHMTLSNWFRDYVYIPLGGNRRGVGKQMRNALITMGLAGLWHGAAWTFVLWGALHGCWLALEDLLKHCSFDRFIRAIPKWIKIVFTFHAVSILWILFRSQSIQISLDMITLLFTSPYSGIFSFFKTNTFPLLLIFVFMATHGFDSFEKITTFFKRKSPVFSWIFIFFAWILSLAISTGSSAKFIYYDF